jgi:phosphocarrier protein HPr
MGFLNRKTETSDKAAKQLEILNRLGLHARPCSKFVKLCNNFKSEIWVEKDGEQVNARSIMGLMMLAAGQGSKITVLCEGVDSKEALAAVEQLILNKFDED